MSNVECRSFKTDEWMRSEKKLHNSIFDILRFAVNCVKSTEAVKTGA